MTTTGGARIFLVFLILFSHGSLSFGGQIVTGQTQEWARKAVTEEKSLQTVPAQNSVAVLYFMNKTGKKSLDPIRKGMAVMLITDLSTVKGLQVVERTKVQALVQELGLGASGLVDPASAPRIGRLLGAKSLVGGEFTGEEARLQVQSPVLDVPTTAIVGQPSATESIHELFRIEKELLFQIIDLLKIKLKPEEQARLRKPCSSNPKALFDLFAAVDASDSEDYEQAAELYESALQEDPGICLAGNALNELHYTNLLPVRRPTKEALQTVRDTTSLTNQVTPKDEVRFVPTPNESTTTSTNIQLVFPSSTTTDTSIQIAFPGQTTTDIQVVFPAARVRHGARP